MPLSLGYYYVSRISEAHVAHGYPSRALRLFILRLNLPDIKPMPTPRQMKVCRWIDEGSLSFAIDALKGTRWSVYPTELTFTVTALGG
jgi:hypothetical protein